jgi:hypothetical protein
MTKGESYGKVKKLNGQGKKHEIPPSDSAAGENAASLTERRDDEALEIAKKSQPLRMVKTLNRPG